MPSINSARYAQRIIQTESHESPSFLRKVHRLDRQGYQRLKSGGGPRGPTLRVRRPCDCECDSTGTVAVALLANVDQQRQYIYIYTFCGKPSSNCECES